MSCVKKQNIGSLKPAKNEGENSASSRVSASWMHSGGAALGKSVETGEIHPQETHGRSVTGCLLECKNEFQIG